MDRAERAEYNRLRAADSRKRRKEKEDLLEEKKRFEEEEKRQYMIKPEEKALDAVPEKWQDSFHSFLDQDTALDKIATELNRQWLYSFDVRTIRELQRLIFGVENKFIQADEYLRVLGEFPDVVLSETIKSLQTRPGFNAESDLIDLRKSPTFMEIYKDALWKAYSLNDPKYTPLMDSKMWSSVKAEFQRVCQD